MKPITYAIYSIIKSIV